MAARLLPRGTATVLGPLLQSAEDPRKYRYLTLPNRLNVLCVSDPNADRAAASMSVGVGHFADPLPGMAHFVEHLCFLGA
jgi:insulysin